MQSSNIKKPQICGFLCLIFSCLSTVNHLFDFSSEVVFENGYSWASISSYLSTLLSSMHLGAVIVTLISLSILIIWDKIPSLKKFKLMPGALVAVVVGTL